MATSVLRPILSVKPIEVNPKSAVPDKGFWIPTNQTALLIGSQPCKQDLDTRGGRIVERPCMTSYQSAETPHWGIVDLRRANEAAGVALWSWNVDTDRITMDEHGFCLWDVGVQREIEFENLSGQIHPADRDRVRSAFSATRAVSGGFDIDFRIMCDNAVRWISARGQGENVNAVGPVKFGIFLDITDRKQAEEANELLAGEMSHRVKNLLAIASSLATIASKTAKSAEEMAHDLTKRLAALSRAHDVIRPTPAGENAALLNELISVVLAPYHDFGGSGDRVSLSVPNLATGDGGATNLALILHELATNSVKYGALSVDTGTVEISCTIHKDEIELVWAEQGGPPVAEPAEGGFGSKLLMRMAAQLGGTLSSEWAPGGLIVKLVMKTDYLVA